MDILILSYSNGRKSANVYVQIGNLECQIEPIQMDITRLAL